MNTLHVIMRGILVLSAIVAAFGLMLVIVLGPATLIELTGNYYWGWLYAPFALPVLYAIGRDF